MVVLMAFRLVPNTVAAIKKRRVRVLCDVMGVNQAEPHADLQNSDKPSH